MRDDDLYDITIIGAGPTGLFAAFYAGMRRMRAKVLDALPEPGGQLMALYPEKDIYDAPGFPRIKARDLVRLLVEQGLQHGATLCLGQRVQGLERISEDPPIFRLTTDREEHYTRTVLIAIGVGAFAPRKLDRPGVREFEGRGVHYFVRDLQHFQGKRILIVGGGDSAVDWALGLEGIAEHITLIHRRDAFRAHEDSVRKLFQSSVVVKPFYEVKELRGDEHLQEALIVHNRTGEEERLEVSEVLFCLGFVADPGPIKDWGLEMDSNGIRVSPRMETNIPGVYAAGDITSHPAKLKLIATAYGEAAIAVNFAKTFIDPSARAFPGHSTEVMAGSRSSQGTGNP